MDFGWLTQTVVDLAPPPHLMRRPVRGELIRLSLATFAGPLLVLLAIVILVRVIADVVED